MGALFLDPTYTKNHIFPRENASFLQKFTFLRYTVPIFSFYRPPPLKNTHFASGFWWVGGNSLSAFGRSGPRKGSPPQVGPGGLVLKENLK